MNLNELSQKLEDHLTDQDIQDAQELLDSTYQEIVDMRGELVEAQAELSALRTQAIADAAELDALKAQNAELLAALRWYGEQSRLARLITSEGDAGRNAIASDGGQKAKEAIANARGDL